MSSCAEIDCVNSSGKNPSLSFHQIPPTKRNVNRMKRIKREQNEKYLPEDSTLYICSEHFENDCFERDLQVSFINF